MALLPSNRVRQGSAARGFTLIEILITLVVLVIGIYAMLRVFPRGFTAIEVGEQRTIASQLAEAELARWKLHPEALPDAVVATDYEGNLIGGTIRNNADTLTRLLVYGEAAAVMPGTTNYRPLILPMGSVGVGNLDFYAKALIYSPLDLTPSQFDAAQAVMLEGQPRRPSTIHPNWEPNSLYLPRTVLGERVDIRRLGSTGQGILFYLLSHAPLDVLKLEGEDNPATPGDDRIPVYVQVYDAQPWSYLPAGELLERQFTLDPATGVLRFGPSASPPPEARLFKVDYTHPTTFERVLGFPVIAGAGSAQGAPALPLGVDPDTIQVHEQLQQVGNLALLRVTDDTARRNIYYVDAESAISGRIMFPQVLQVDPRPTDISLVKIDYRVYDWAILGFDVEVPDSGIVRLPIGRIKGPSFANPPRQPRPQEVARGVKRYHNWDGTVVPRGALDPSTWAYVVAVDRQSGQILTDHEGAGWPINPWDRQTRFLVNYNTGLLDFNYASWEVYQYNPALETGNRMGRTYRIFCRGENDWAVQLMITPRVYGRSEDGLPGGQPVGGEGAGPVLLTYGWSGAPNRNPRQVYFPLSERGQAVAIDYYYDPEPMNGTEADLVYVEGEVHSIGEPNVTDLGQWVAPLSQPLAHAPQRWGPRSVRGIGVRARSVWVTPGRAATVQDLVYALSQPTPVRATPSLSETWRQQVVDTYLTRAPI
jgi:prepilin-type N-terminal cleavage/methylation domain-containing protein